MSRRPLPDRRYGDGRWSPVVRPPHLGEPRDVTVGKNRRVTDSGASGPSLSGTTAWIRRLQSPLGRFLRTETGSAAVLLAATLLALIWANVASTSYQDLWHTDLSLRLGGRAITQDLRGWVNNGLMTFFFFVVGLEARREFDMGELRERRRLLLPVVAGVSGMIILWRSTSP